MTIQRMDNVGIVVDDLDACSGSSFIRGCLFARDLRIRSPVAGGASRTGDMSVMYSRDMSTSVSA